LNQLHLTELDHLFDFFDCRGLTKVGFHSLARLRSIQYLNVSSTRIHGVDDFFSKNHALQQLRRWLPNCEVVSDAPWSMST